jgi:hypothetical protein
MIALAGDLNFFSPGIFTGRTAVFVARLRHAPAWKVRALVLLICSHP